MTFPFPPQPLSEQEKEALAEMLGPELARQLLEKGRKMEETQMTTAMDWRLHWRCGKLGRADLTETKATSILIR